jgi:hypothetical protein
MVLNKNRIDVDLGLYLGSRLLSLIPNYILPSTSSYRNPRNSSERKEKEFRAELIPTARPFPDISRHLFRLLIILTFF